MQYTGNALHPTQKPLLAVIPLILAFTNKGDIILDPFIGLGTTTVAAQQLGRRYIGIELEPRYCHLAQAELKKGGEPFMAWNQCRQKTYPQRHANAANGQQKNF